MVGVGVTMVSAIVPARRAVRIAPVAALAEQREDETSRVRRLTLVRAVILAIVGTVLIVVGLSKASLALVGFGGLALLISTTLFTPLLARPLSSALGRPLVRTLGVPGRLGRENSMRNPRRTAQTAAALMVGLSLVSTIAVLGASLSASAKNEVDSAINADYIVTGNGGFSKSVVPAVSRVPGVTTSTVVYQGQFEVGRGSLSTLVAATPAGLAQYGQSAHHRRPRGLGDGGRRAASGFAYGVVRPHSCGVGRAGQIRSDRLDDDDRRRDLQVKPAARRLRHRRPVLPVAFRQPAPDRGALRAALPGRTGCFLP